MENKQKKIERKNGITLIALAVTIVVLLILAGTSIAMLTGDSGIFGRTKEAKEKNEREKIIEQAKLDIIEWLIEKNEKGEDATLNDDMVKGIITGKSYILGIPGDKSFISNPSGLEIFYSELYQSNSGSGLGESWDNSQAKYFKFRFDEDTKEAAITGVFEEYTIFVLYSGGQDYPVGIHDNGSPVTKLYIPSSVTYQGEKYTVTSFDIGNGGLL